MVIKQFLLALDQIFNTLIDNGMADETLSARAYRMTDASIGWRDVHVLIDWVFKKIGMDNHCYKSYLAEVNRTQLPKEYQERQYKSEHDLFTSRQVYDISKLTDKIG